jgi:photosystem II stability/assembly factor-like uncharacterized protein
LGDERGKGEVLVVAPDLPSVRWRARPGGILEHSADGGATWARLEFREPRQILAGAAPSRAVCWFVGRRGLVVRIVPGAAPLILSAPAVADLIEVEANGALAAKVLAADGRSFLTSDGGVTWRR